MSQTLSGAHTRWNIRYHFVWIVKYRHDWFKNEQLRGKLKEVIQEIGKRYDFIIDELATDFNHVHLFLGAPPRYSPAQIMNIIKSISAKELLNSFPEVKQALWGAEFGGDGYYVRTVGKEVTEDVIREYIKNQGKDTNHPSFEQLRFF